MHDSRTSKYQPLRNILYNQSGQNDDRSVFVVPRRVYFDTRIHVGKPRNVVLILAEVHDNAVETVLACELNGYFSESILVIKENTDWVRSHKPGYTHCAILVECMGLPLESVTNGSFAKLVYKNEGDDYYSLVETEKPLIFEIADLESVPVRGSGLVVACTTLYGHPKQFNNWLKYQKTIGVDFVHIK